MRVIAGRFRGRDLGAVPRGVRPTTDRVRESLFASLGPLDGLRVLDLFAGTGALGIEACSRGADAVFFVERARGVARALEKRLEGLGLDPNPTSSSDSSDAEPLIRVLQSDATGAIDALAREGIEPFDLALLDPPYDEGEADVQRTEIADHLASSGLLAEDARVVIEGPKRHPVAPPARLRMVRETRYGETILTWLEARQPR